MGNCCGRPEEIVVPDKEGKMQFGSAPATSTATAESTNARTALSPRNLEGEALSAASSELTKGQTVDAYYSKSAVKVAVNVRPLLDNEIAKGNADCISIEGRDTIRLPQRISNIQQGNPTSTGDGAHLSFSFDRVYKGVSRHMFREMAEPVLQQFLKGFNATIFAYGQTGSGKTYTMGTAVSGQQVLGLQEESIIPRALHLVFQTLAAISQEYTTIMKVTYVQIHEDSVKDLLVDQNSPMLASITLREHPLRGIHMDNAREVDVKNLADVASALEQGNARRAVAAHNLNEFSSRSHAVLQLTLEQKRKASAPHKPEKHKFLQSKLNLVDLAGSERAKDTGTSGQQFNEGVQINQGLLALGNVIAALTEGKSRKHVPYRDSKLTRILQDSLGGTSETLMIACVSPASCNLEQTINTLRYASRARRIQNKLKLNNKICLEDELAFLRKTVAEKEAIIAQLQQENASLKAGKRSFGTV